MVGLAGDPPATAHNVDSTTRGNTSKSPKCDHKCVVITLSIAIPLLLLFIAAIFAFRFLRMRREMRKNAKDQETEIAMRKLGSESESSSVVESYGDLHAVTNLEDARRPEKAAGSWRSETVAANTPGWWRA
ncbi:hypothetical protein BDR22DRAFT_883996 [Usnea florida]